MVGCTTEVSPGFFEVTAPTHNAIGLPYSPTIQWTAAERADTYVIELLTVVGESWVAGYRKELPASMLEYTIPEADLPSFRAAAPIYQLTVAAVNSAGETPTLPVLFHAGDYPVFSGGQTYFAWKYLTCAAGENDSGVSGSAIVIETTNNCSAPQSFYFERTSIDLSAYASGHIAFRIENTNAGQNINFRIQDANAVTSMTKPLTDYGYDPAKANMVQPISIPISDLSSGLALGEMERVFYVEISCPTTNCYSSFSNVEWTLR